MALPLMENGARFSFIRLKYDYCDYVNGLPPIRFATVTLRHIE